MSDELQHYTGLVSSIDETTPFSDVMNTINLIKEGKRRLTEIQKEAESHAIAFIQTHGEQQLGEVRHYVGYDREWKCNDARDAFNALMDALGGDIDAVLNRCLSTGAMKPGESRKVFDEAGKGEVFLRHFTLQEGPKLETGKPKVKKLQSVNQNFLR